ncbi:MAG: alcohol dehydrogenase family protein [Acidimicrobiales bacterium]
MTEPDPSVPATMAAVLLTGHGGYEKLDYRTDVATPVPGPGQVLIEVGAAGINNTDINTRIGWYSKSVTDATDAGGGAGFGADTDDDGSWTGDPLRFPRIQGADCCGRIVATGPGVDRDRTGHRVLVRSLQPDRNSDRPMACVTLGSELDGAFAQYTVCDERDALMIDSDWSDVELASLPCAYSTAEAMLHRGGVGAERVLITGASGGVGSAAIQLAKRRGAEVIAVAGSAKADGVAALGADRVVERERELLDQIDRDSVDVVLDLVAGPGFGSLLEALRAGGRYVTSGAIAGPIVDLDVRTLYLKDLSFFGSTYQPDEIFENLVFYVEAGEIRPVVAGTYPLADIVEAQQEFLDKRHVGKLVLVPPR